MKNLKIGAGLMVLVLLAATGTAFAENDTDKPEYFPSPDDTEPGVPRVGTMEHPVVMDLGAVGDDTESSGEGSESGH